MMTDNWQFRLDFDVTAISESKKNDYALLLSKDWRKVQEAISQNFDLLLKVNENYYNLIKGEIETTLLSLKFIETEDNQELKKKIINGYYKRNQSSWFKKLYTHDQDYKSLNTKIGKKIDISRLIHSMKDKISKYYSNNPWKSKIEIEDLIYKNKDHIIKKISKKYVEKINEKQKSKDDGTQLELSL